MISSQVIQKAIDGDTTTTSTEDFQKVLDSAINMVNETNEYQHKAEPAYGVEAKYHGKGLQCSHNTANGSRMGRYLPPDVDEGA